MSPLHQRRNTPDVDPSTYSTIMASTAFGSSFLVFSSGTWVNTRQPKNLKWEVSGIFLNKSSNEVMLLTLDTVRFFTYATHCIAKPHGSRGTFLPYIWLRTDSTTVLFARSATPFSWGVYGGVNWWVIPVPKTWHHQITLFRPQSLVRCLLQWSSESLTISNSVAFCGCAQ